MSVPGITFGKVFLATDLNWQPCRSDADARRKALAAMEIADSGPVSGGADSSPVIVVRNSHPMQYAATRRYRPDSVALAALLADVLGSGSHWAGVFAVPEGYYYVEVRKGVITAGRSGDQLFSKDERDKAFKRIQEATKNSQLEQFFAPDDFGLTQAEAVNLFDLLKDISQPVLYHNAFRPVKRAKPGRRKMWSFAGLAAATAGALVVWQMWPQEREVHEGPRREFWTDKPAMASGITACVKSIYDRPILAGFSAKVVTCDKDGGEFTYQEFAPVALKWYKQPEQCGPYTIKEGSLVLKCKIDKIDLLQQRPAKILSRKEGLRELYARFRALGYDVRLPMQDTPPGIIPSRELDVTIIGDMPPTKVADVYKTFPLFIFRSVSLDVEKGNWIVEGTLYVE